MHIIDHRILGVLILLLLAILVAVKRMATGSLFEKPEPDVLLWLVNLFNLFFLLIANPLAAILLITGTLADIDPTSLAIAPVWLAMIVETVGLAVYLLGFLLMGWALITLRGNYQLGGSRPRAGDTLIIRGPYVLLRHPMYTAALCIAFGLACLTGSLGCFVAWIIYLFLIVRLVPLEEESLLQAYGERYASYQQKVKSLFPFLF